MKKILRPILCGGVLAALLCTPSLAAEQGDFSLLVNGEPVAFTDAAPVLKDGRSFLPMAATFEALGFPAEDMTWDSDTQTAAASKDGTTISLTIGKNAIQVTQAGAEAGVSIETDAAPYIDAATSRTYIPVGLVADAVARLVPGVLSDPECFEEESHWNGLLEYPQYSRPEEWHGRKVPPILRSGDHKNIARWRRKQSILRTRQRRPDLYARLDLSSKEDQKLLRELDEEAPQF